MQGELEKHTIIIRGFNICLLNVDMTKTFKKSKKRARGIESHNENS